MGLHVRTSKEQNAGHLQFPSVFHEYGEFFPGLRKKCAGLVFWRLFIPFMSANMDVLIRSHTPLEIQGRVYSVRNTLQFFTIPVGYLLGGLFVDKVFEPIMGRQAAGSYLVHAFGSGKGSGAAMLFFFLGITGVLICLFFRKDRHLWDLEERM